ncbi:MAG TPA: L-threonylcarbamoyladenylate synthase [Gemmataceae bacterium]|nr:L-threonylcarbamoyladenylate synthase [Gemmataceae bacterium]
MKTDVVAVDPAVPNAEALAEAARVLRGGGLVAFPTETVYGLGANALDASAVARIFAAKGRPATNPLIVHVSNAGEARNVVADWPASAALLAEHFWPGPLTLVLPKRDTVPDVVTAGGPTVAVRVPAHPVAQALLRAADLPIAAPSANRSTELSPTRAEHVLHGLGGRIEMLLDGGPTSGGIESTVLDLTATPPRLLRPGPIGVAELEAALGSLIRVRSLTVAAQNSPQPLPSPGMMPRHYAPRTPLECVEAGKEPERLALLLSEKRRIGWVTFADSGVAPPGVLVRVLPSDPAGYAAQLYAVLHELDAARLDCILVTMPPDTDDWLAVRDRLRRASHS